MRQLLPTFAWPTAVGVKNHLGRLVKRPQQFGGALSVFIGRVEPHFLVAWLQVDNPARWLLDDMHLIAARQPFDLHRADDQHPVAFR